MAKPYHKAKLVNHKGQVSPLCAKSPKPLNLKTGLWTNRAEAVTCKKCLLLLRTPQVVVTKERT